MKNIKAYKEANKALWDHWASLHPSSEFYDNDSFIDHQMALNAIELDLLHDVKDKDVLHLQCHFGQDTISLKTLGARSISGLDFSHEAVKQAQKLAEACQVEARFIQRDVLDVDPALEHAFDFVFASYGVVGWHPDAKAWMDAAFHYLKPGGKLLLVDFHPVLWILDEEFKEIKYPYFNTGVIKEEREGSYASPEAKKMVNFTWNHSISDLVKPIVDHPERSMIYFNEYDWSPYEIFEASEKEPGHYQIKGKEGLFPLVYAIKAEKKI
jgi:SAM-dependent methyltransferase